MSKLQLYKQGRFHHTAVSFSRCMALIVMTKEETHGNSLQTESGTKERRPCPYTLQSFDGTTALSAEVILHS